MRVCVYAFEYSFNGYKITEFGAVGMCTNSIKNNQIYRIVR